MLFARILLFLNGALFIAYGVVCLFNPLYPAAEAFGVTATLPAQALTEIRAMYGGLQISFGGLLLLAAFISRWLHSLLWIFLVVIGSLAAARLFGAWLDNSWSSAYIQYVLLYEWGAFALTALALIITPRARTPESA